jgi:hypothetical protein
MAYKTAARVRGPRGPIVYVSARLEIARKQISSSSLCQLVFGMAGTSQFVFPILKNADIVLCLQELGVPFVEEDLTKPTPQRMQMVYEAFADILMGYTRETFEANVRACAAEVENFVQTTILVN